MIIVENFKAHCQPKIGGLAKAMVVASSRIQAFMYNELALSINPCGL
jgi:plasmid maintenance system antidote protein VapI